MSRRLLIAVIAIAALTLILRRAADRPVSVHSSAGTTAERKDGVPNVARRTVPLGPGYDGCPAAGDGGDRTLNILKNRVDSATWVPTPFSAVVSLPWPPNVTRRARAEWTRRDSLAVARSEGLPVSIEGYFVGAKLEGPEATNCHGAESRFRDWHLWLSAAPGKDHRRSIVVETTPAVRATHPEWSLTRIHELVRDSVYVRVSGWLLFDQDHPEQIGKTRGTLWEIHPVMKIEVMRGGKWTDQTDSLSRFEKHAQSHRD